MSRSLRKLAIAKMIVELARPLTTDAPSSLPHKNHAACERQCPVTWSSLTMMGISQASLKQIRLVLPVMRR